ncbi:MAG: HEPN domain protein [Candidatus Woesebacteria bacterium GW2011_GWA2_40_7]|uniref:HEPN domain protein n=3 Tax=Candidatus Woeseibacteriota TaxID=1752722 RepID=A0A0G0X6B8_9BACT|nr:MAG: HEPN domain protein [Candidatus Woesebacteria bacterium GW2011_GWB1_39_10]KKR73052.1 MAG: HEPN domain protein [Candidatus Woesebacteria bacterium GW2011_GWA2_40_7]KKR92195.1 MAG: HEPN domain protein [Candidatus Woesebacteria bacterium GW2011_GWA1_41_13b]
MSPNFEPLKYWKESAQDTLDTSDRLFDSQKFHHSLFFLHLTLEKILKALYIYTKNESPPPIHDLVRLAEKCFDKIDESTKLELAEISTFNVSARYDDYKLQFYKKATKEYAQKWRGIGKRIFNQYLSQIK